MKIVAWLNARLAACRLAGSEWTHMPSSLFRADLRFKKRKLNFTVMDKTNKVFNTPVLFWFKIFQLHVLYPEVTRLETDAGFKQGKNQVKVMNEEHWKNKAIKTIYLGWLIERTGKSGGVCLIAQAKNSLKYFADADRSDASSASHSPSKIASSRHIVSSRSYFPWRVNQWIVWIRRGSNWNF